MQELHNSSPNHVQTSFITKTWSNSSFPHLQNNEKLVLHIIQFCSIILNLILYYKYSQFITPLQSKINQSFMATNPPLKNYYQILGVSQSASLFEIENAYEKLAAKWHPDKHKEHRKSAEAKFHDISEAFEVLSDRNKRAHYDELLIKQYSLEDAHSTFDRFFNEHGIIDEEEEKFFNEHYPSPLSNYYKVLGLPKTATLDDIKKAYRKLAIQYHPKTNPDNKQAHKKFIEVNEAYNALSDEFKKANYDNIIFGEIAPVRAHDIFQDFFGSRWFDLDDDDFRPIFHNRWTKNLDRMMIDENEENIRQGQTIKTSSYWTNKNGQETGKTVTTKKTVKDGKANEETTEEYTFPNGEKNIVKTTKVDGKIETKKYSLKKGEEVPKELTE